jgi:hypothetical protein
MFNASYLQNSLHSALETIVEESSASATTCGAAPVEYPPNMMFYAEYPGGTLTPTLSSGNHSSHTNKVSSCMLTVDYRIKVHMDLQADKSPIVVKGPFFPRVVDPRYRIRGTMCNARIQSSKARKTIY